MLSRRALIIHLSTTALVGALAMHVHSAAAADKTVTIGINLPLTGADAHDAELIKDGAHAGDRRGQRAGRRRRLQDRGDAARRRHRHRRPVRPGPGRDQRPQDGLRQDRRRRDRAADERLGQGDVADPEPRRSGHGHPELDQSRHHRPEIRRPVPAEGQGDLFPHGDDRRLSGPQHGQLFRRHAEGQIGLCARRQRRLRGRARRCVPGAGREARHQGPRPRPAQCRRRPTTRPC